MLARVCVFFHPCLVPNHMTCVFVGGENKRGLRKLKNIISKMYVVIVGGEREPNRKQERNYGGARDVSHSHTHIFYSLLCNKFQFSQNDFKVE
jgi:hypothetical protein